MVISEEDNTVDSSEFIEIFSTDDEKMKKIGELLGNDSSRQILKLLFDTPMTASQIAQKMEILLSLVIYHLNKMIEVGIVKIDKVVKNQKEHDMKYYTVAKFAVIILPPKLSAKAKTSKSLKNSLTRIYKFSAIGIAGLVSWVVIENISGTSVGTRAPVTTVPEHVFWSVVIPLTAIICGLVVERIFKLRKH